MKKLEDLICEFRTDAVPLGAMYVLPDGTMLDLSYLENGHAEFFAMAGCSAATLKEIGWLRLNTKLKYVDMPPAPTQRQLAALSKVYSLFGTNFQGK